MLFNLECDHVEEIDDDVLADQKNEKGVSSLGRFVMWDEGCLPDVSYILSKLFYFLYLL